MLKRLIAWFFRERVSPERKAWADQGHDEDAWEASWNRFAGLSTVTALAVGEAERMHFSAENSRG